MRLITLLVTASLGVAPALADQPQASPAPATTSAPKDGPTDLPVSIERIRTALQNTPAEPLKGIDEKPHFRVEVQEKQRWEDLISHLKFESTPPVRGGIYAYEQQQTIWPTVQNPLMQPYGAFNQGQLVQVLITEWLQRYFAGRALNSITSAERTHAETAARQEVEQQIAQYCAAQPNAGAGIQICTPSTR